MTYSPKRELECEVFPKNYLTYSEIHLGNSASSDSGDMDWIRLAI